MTNTGVTDFNCDNLGLLVGTSINPASFVILSCKSCNSSMDSGKKFEIISLILCDPENIIIYYYLLSIQILSFRITIKLFILLIEIYIIIY